MRFIVSYLKISNNLFLNYKYKQMSKTSKVRLTFLGILVLAILSGLIVYPKVPKFMPGNAFFNKFTPRLGLDLQGGAHLVYQADFSKVDTKDKKASLDGVKDVVERRVNTFGVAEPLVQTSGEDKIIIELAGVFDVNDAIKRIGETPLLEFKELTGTDSATVDQGAIDTQNAQNKKLAEEILARAIKGEDFATLAREYSEDPGSKEKDGIVDFVKQEMLDPAYGDVIFNKLSNSQISTSIVESQFGYHIIKKLEERGTGADKEVKSQHILFLKKTAQAQEQWTNTQLSGKQLKSSDVQFDNTTGMAQVGLEFNDEGKQLFADITKRNVGKPVGIFLDGEVITAPKVNEEITGGRAVIEGGFGIQEAKQLSQRLNAGALPVPINLVSQQTVGPMLGKDSLDKSLQAGVWGIILIALFMLFYYRLPGILSIFALLIYSTTVIAIFEIWPVTLTLSGITGFIFSIGVAVDANVLIFERTKEELRRGKDVVDAIEEGFKRAWTSVRDSNYSSIITCVILYYFGSSMIKGFAVTLTIGILISMFSAITVTRTFLRLIASSKMNKHLWLFGVRNKKSSSEIK